MTNRPQRKRAKVCYDEFKKDSLDFFDDSDDDFIPLKKPPKKIQKLGPDALSPPFHVLNKSSENSSSQGEIVIISDPPSPIPENPKHKTKTQSPVVQPDDFVEESDFSGSDLTDIDEYIEDLAKIKSKTTALKLLSQDSNLSALESFEIHSDEINVENNVLASKTSIDFSEQKSTKKSKPSIESPKTKKVLSPITKKTTLSSGPSAFSCDKPVPSPTGSFSQPSASPMKDPSIGSTRSKSSLALHPTTSKPKPIFKSEIAQPKPQFLTPGKYKELVMVYKKLISLIFIERKTLHGESPRDTIVRARPKPRFPGVGLYYSPNLPPLHPNRGK